MTEGSGRVPLGRGGEFDLIRRLLGPDEPLPGAVKVGPGDDCAVLDGGWVVSTDLFMEGIHFRTEWISPKEAGFRAAAAALSDLAAMAAHPVGALLAMALTPAGGWMAWDAAWTREAGGVSGPGTGEGEGVGSVAAEVQAGAAEACRLEGVGILGGDLVRSSGPLAICVTVIGRSGAPVLRRGGRPGDEVWVTGRLGGCAGAVERWRRGEEPARDLREAFARPRPRIREALWLSTHADLRGLIDLSDGLAGDAGHLAAASGVSLILMEDRIPVHPGLSSGGPEGSDPLLLALRGGEDFELCLVASPGALDEWVEPFKDSFGLPLTKVGWVAEGEGVFLRGPDGMNVPLDSGGYSHFSQEETG